MLAAHCQFIAKTPTTKNSDPPTLIIVTMPHNSHIQKFIHIKSVSISLRYHLKHANPRASKYGTNNTPPISITFNAMNTANCFISPLLRCCACYLLPIAFALVFNHRKHIMEAKRRLSFQSKIT